MSRRNNGIKQRTLSPAGICSIRCLLYETTLATKSLVTCSTSITLILTTSSSATMLERKETTPQFHHPPITDTHRHQTKRRRLYFPHQSATWCMRLPADGQQQILIRSKKIYSWWWWTLLVVDSATRASRLAAATIRPQLLPWIHRTIIRRRRRIWCRGLSARRGLSFSPF